MRAAKLFPVLRIALGALLCASAVSSSSRAEEPTVLASPSRSSYEGSSLLKVENAALLQANHWKRAFWMAFDEGDQGTPLGLLGQKEVGGAWEVKEVAITPRAGRPKIDDTEALARKGGFIYLVGSHFGKKKGELEAARQFIARFREDEAAGTSPAVDLDVRRDDFALHRLLNDGLSQRKIGLIDRGPHEQAEYIEKTRKSGEPGADRVLQGDRALNIEGATFLDSGQLALGLRYPVTQQGDPLVVVIDNVETFFQQNPSEKKLPAVTTVWILHATSAPVRLRGLRELNSSGGEIQAIVGSIERASDKNPVILQDHPGAETVTSEHWAFTVPAAGALVVEARRVRDLAPDRNVEGVTVDGGDDWYLFDEEKVRVRRETHTPP